MYRITFVYKRDGFAKYEAYFYEKPTYEEVTMALHPIINDWWKLYFAIEDKVEFDV